jgi:hypothetical protein
VVSSGGNRALWSIYGITGEVDSGWQSAYGTSPETTHGELAKVWLPAIFNFAVARELDCNPVHVEVTTNSQSV